MPTKALTYAQRANLAAGRKQNNYDHRPSAAARGYDADWQRVRMQVLREHPACTYCEHPATIVDHKKPIAAGGARLDRENLRPLCGLCHGTITGHYRATGINEMPPSHV